LKGKPDAIVRTKSGELIPVERKKTRAPKHRPYDGDLIQATAYCVLVEETYGRIPPLMRIQYADRSFDDPYTPQHKQWVQQVSVRLRAARRAGACNRSHQIPAKCPALRPEIELRTGAIAESLVHRLGPACPNGRKELCAATIVLSKTSDSQGSV
jgi:hypothetical protein